MELNNRALQVAGCLNPAKFRPIKDVRPQYLSGGSWHANLHQDGVKYLPSKGGIHKARRKSRPRNATGCYKEKTFNTVMLRLPSTVKTDRHGWVIPQQEETM